MRTKKKKLTKTIILILMLLSFTLGLKYFKVAADFSSYKKNAVLENRVLDSQLSEMLHKYDSISVKNKIDSIRLTNQINAILVGKIDKNDLTFTSAQDSIVFLANEKQKYSKSSPLSSKSELTKPSSVLKAKADQFKALNINTKGVKIYSDNYNLKDAKIKQLRVCFTLEENAKIKAGEKEIYIQVVNPKNQIISSENTSIASSTNVLLQYSAAVSANYLKKDTDVCTYVNLEQNKTIKGKYKVNIYHDFMKIGNAVFEY